MSNSSNISVKAILAKCIAFSLATTFFISLASTVTAQKYRYDRRTDKQETGAYYLVTDKKDSKGHREKIRNEVRLINIRYQGTADANLWKQAFLQAASQYKRNNWTYRKGGDGDFFRMGGTTNSTKYIFGYYNYTNDTFAYVVVTDITSTKVRYVDHNGTVRVAVKDPNNFLNYKIGFDYYVSDIYGDHGTDRYVRLQLWRDGKSKDACGCLWIQGFSR